MHHNLFYSKAAESGVSSWDCKYDEEVLLVPYPLLIAGDNPMQAEECSHAGLTCNKFCRTCKVGGTKVHKASDGFADVFEVCSMSIEIKKINPIIYYVAWHPTYKLRHGICHTHTN